MQHALHKLTKWAPVVLPRSQLMLIDEQHVVLEAGVEMWFQSELEDDWVVMAVDVGVDSVQTLEHLADESWEGLGECYAWLRC